MLFEEEDGGLRYVNAGRHAVALAQRLAEGFRAKGYDLHLDSPTNQQFVVLDDAAKARLASTRRSASGSSRRTAAPSCASRPVGPRGPRPWTSCWRCCRRRGLPCPI
ncbi:MAG: hypothetical protein V8S24_09300 [Gordonibacter pamelaeae]